MESWESYQQSVMTAQKIHGKKKKAVGKADCLTNVYPAARKHCQANNTLKLHVLIFLSVSNAVLVEPTSISYFTSLSTVKRVQYSNRNSIRPIVFTTGTVCIEFDVTSEASDKTLHSLIFFFVPVPTLATKQLPAFL